MMSLATPQLIDPGCYEIEEQLDLLDFITEKKPKGHPIDQ